MNATHWLVAKQNLKSEGRKLNEIYKEIYSIKLHIVPLEEVFDKATNLTLRIALLGFTCTLN